MQKTLSPRNIDFLHFCVMHGGFFTVRQATNYYYNKFPGKRNKESSERNTRKILSGLEKNKYINCHAIPMRSKDDARRVQPKLIYFFNKQNIKKIVRDLEADSNINQVKKADLFLGYLSDFSDKAKGYQENLLRHEEELTDCLVALKNHPQAYLIRFSPRNQKTIFSLTLKTKYTERGTNQKTGETKLARTYTVNHKLTPDAFLFFRTNENEYQFYPIEYDRNTNRNSHKVRDRIQGYIALQQNPEIFKQVVDKILWKFDFPAPKKAIFQPLFIIEDEYTRNSQLALSAQHTTLENGRRLSNFLQFASYKDVMDDPQGAIWLNQKSVGSQIINEFTTNIKTISQRPRHNKSFKEKIDTTRKTALFPAPRYTA